MEFSTFDCEQHLHDLILHEEIDSKENLLKEAKEAIPTDILTTIVDSNISYTAIKDQILTMFKTLSDIESIVFVVPVPNEAKFTILFSRTYMHIVQKREQGEVDITFPFNQSPSEFGKNNNPKFIKDLKKLNVLIEYLHQLSPDNLMKNIELLVERKQ